MAPWVNLTVAVGGAAAPCCEIKGRLGDAKRQTLEQIWRGDAFNALRKQLLRDAPTPRCWKCYDVEDNGGRSMRQDYNKDFGAEAARLIEPYRERGALPLPLALDIRFSNLCNLTCRMCWHGSSSRWFVEAKALGWTNSDNALIRSFADVKEGVSAIAPLLDTVETIYWAGGEPLLLEEHYAVLDALLARGRDDVRLCYNTNMMALSAGKLQVLDRWVAMKRVEVEVSIDGAGRRGELIRAGLIWDRFVENVRQVHQRCPHVRLSFGVTVSIFNVAELAALHSALVAFGVCGVDDFRIHVLQQWEGYSITVLPAALKTRFAELLEDYIASLPQDAAVRHSLRHVIAHMLATDRSDLLDKFRDVTLTLDRMRGESTAAVCPELAELLI